MRNKANENYGKGTNNFSEGLNPNIHINGKNPV